MRKRKRFLFSLLCLAIIFSLAIPISPPAEASPATIYVPDGCETIQAAVDVASPGDTIIVYPGTYTENVDVNKDHLTIQSQNGADSTIVQAANPDDSVFEVTGDYVEISGFTAEGATGSNRAGIYLDNVDHCQISYNIILNNKHGIYLNDSSYNNIAGNTVKSCVEDGIILDYSPTPGPYLSPVGHNDPDDQWEDEPLAYDGNTDTFAKVRVSRVAYSSWLEFFAPTEKSQGIRFWLYPEFPSCGHLQIDLFYDGQWRFLKRWQEGAPGAPCGEWVEIDYPEEVVEKARFRFRNPSITGSKWGYLSEFQFKTTLGISSSNNDIVRNTVSNNGVGIRLYHSSDNRIYLNNFVNNTDNGYSSDSSNLCNSPEQITYSYHSNTYINYVGNYWSDYGAYFPPVGHNDPDDQWKDEVLAYDENRDTYAKVYVGSTASSSLELIAPLGKTSQGIRFWVNRGFLSVDIYYGGGWHGLASWSWPYDPAPTNQWVELDYPEETVEKARIRFNLGMMGRYWAYLHEFQFKTAPADYSRSDADGDGIGDTPYSIDSDKDNYPLMEPFENYREVGYAVIVAGQGGWREKWGIDHGANNAYRVLRNLGFDDEHIFYLNSKGPQDIDGDGDDEVDAPALLNYFENAINEVRDKIGDNPTPFILYLNGHGQRDPDCFIFDEDDYEEGYLWVSALQEMLDNFSSKTPMLIVIGSCYSGRFITSNEGISAANRIIITGAHDKGFWGDRKYLGWLRSSDRIWGNLNKGLNVKEAFTNNALPGDMFYLWLDDNGDRIGHPPNNLGDDGELAATTQIGVLGTEDLRLIPWLFAWMHSPGELRVYDSQNRVTGLVNGEVKEEIPDSIYDEQNEIVAIFSPSDTYHYEVVGTDAETYGLDIASIKDGEATTFTATDVPTASEAVHQYTIDWDVLSEGEEGVTVQTDSDGDGEFEQTITAGSELTGDEFWPYTFEDPRRGTKLYINTVSQTFQFIAPDKEFPIKIADMMRIIDMGWRKPRPEEVIIIRHQDQDIWLSAMAIDENMDFCRAFAKDTETGKSYRLFDERGIELLLGPLGVDFTASKTSGRAATTRSIH